MLFDLLELYLQPDWHHNQHHHPHYRDNHFDPWSQISLAPSIILIIAITQAITINKFATQSFIATFFSTVDHHEVQQCAIQPPLIHRQNQSIRFVKYVKTMQGYWSTSILGTRFAALLHLQGWPLFTFCRSTLIDSLVGSIDSSRRVQQDGARTLGYVDY